MTAEIPELRCSIGHLSPLGPDFRAPIAHSLKLLDAPHGRCVDWLSDLNWLQPRREFVRRGSAPVTLAVVVGSYTCDGRHILGHAEGLIVRAG